MDKKQGPTEMLAEVRRLQAAGKMPSLEKVLAVVAAVRRKYAPKIIAARKLGSDR